MGDAMGVMKRGGGDRVKREPPFLPHSTGAVRSVSLFHELGLESMHDAAAHGTAAVDKYVALICTFYYY